VADLIEYLVFTVGPMIAGAIIAVVCSPWAARFGRWLADLQYGTPDEWFNSNSRHHRE
jgi:hypothetical protein